MSEEALKTCTKCGETKPIADFDKETALKGTNCVGRVYVKGTCRECDNARRRKHYYDNWERNYWVRIRRAHGLTKEQWIAIFESQGRRCACCPRTTPESKKGWAVDHDHTTRVIRGILCCDCNRLLGAARDSPEILNSAIVYLQRPRPDAPLVPIPEPKAERPNHRKKRRKHLDNEHREHRGITLPPPPTTEVA